MSITLHVQVHRRRIYLVQMYRIEVDIKRHDRQQRFCFVHGFTPVD